VKARREVVGYAVRCDDNASPGTLYAMGMGCWSRTKDKALVWVDRSDAVLNLAPHCNACRVVRIVRRTDRKEST